MGPVNAPHRQGGRRCCRPPLTAGLHLRPSGEMSRTNSSMVVAIQKRTSPTLGSATKRVPPTTSACWGIASDLQMPIFSAISIASSTSMPR